MLTLLSACLLCFGFSAQAEFSNGGFEDDYTGWTANGDIYLVTDTGSGRTRHGYLTYQGWEGADVWFAASPAEGDTYMVFGSHGNESDGAILSAAWTATQQYVTFVHAGNATTNYNPKAFAQIRTLSGTVLTQLDVISYNDSVWRTWQIDLAAIGLHYGDQFQFYYEDGASWSVLDDVKQSGAQLQQVASVPVLGGTVLLGLGLLLGRHQRGRTKNQKAG